MAKFCGKCGAELVEGSKFCVKCGAPVPQAGAQRSAAPSGTPGNVQGNVQGNYQQGTANAQGNYQQGTANAQNGYPGASAAKKPFAWPIIAALAAVVVVLSLILFGIFGTKGYEKPIKYMEKGINEGDIKTFAKAFPNGVEGIVNFLPDDLSDLFPGYDVKLEIVDKEKLKKDEMTVILSDEYDLSAAELKDVTAAYILEVEMTSVIDGEEESAEEDIPVVKMDGEWVIPISMFW